MSEPPLPRLPVRLAESHKGDYGRVLLIGGARGMSGAIALAGMAALRSGAGLVRLAVPEVCLDLVASFDPSYMTAPLPADSGGGFSPQARQPLEELAQAADCIAIGPGLGRSPGASALVAFLYRDARQPLVLDADALNALAASPETLAAPGGPRLLTPHPGEFQRLLAGDSPQAGVTSRSPRQEQEQEAISLAGRHRLVVVLKGHRSLVTDGRQVFHNTTGNPGMARGGSGDVLTGVIAALLGQGLPPYDAARLGVHVHGLAGDLAAAELGQIGMTARDLVSHLPAAFLRLG